MKKGANAWTFPEGTPLAEAIRAVRAAGFDAFEPTINAKGELTPETGEAACRRAGDQIRAAGLEVACLASSLSWEFPFTAADPAARARAVESTIASLDRARWIGAPVLLVLPGVVARWWEPKQPLVGYADALKRSSEALKRLAGEAESRRVILGVENVWNQFLLSPVEMRDLVDRVNSPWVRAYFDVGNVLKFGFPQDWIDTLGPRIARVHVKDFKLSVGTVDGFCPLGDGDVDWKAVMAALTRIGYDGPLTYEGPGDPADIARRLGRILALG